MKKVIFYIGSMQLGGANRVVANLSNFFADKGIKVILINDICPQEKKDEYMISGQIKRFFLENNIKNKILKNILMIYELRKIVKAENPDAIVSFMGPPNIRNIIATLGLKTRRVVSVRNDPYYEYGKGIKKYLSKYIFNLADGCVFQTSEAQIYFSKKLQKKSQIILNPVDERFFHVRRKNVCSNIITIGRLEKQKNHELLIRAFYKIKDDFPDVNLIIYGDGNLRTYLEKLIKELKIEDRVIMPGNVSDAWNKLSEAELFVLSSDYEGLPNALMEAMAVGVPIISTDCPCGGPRELILNEKQGVLVKCNEIDLLSNKIKEILQNDDLRKEMSSNVRERALDFKSNYIFEQWRKYIFKGDL